MARVTWPVIESYHPTAAGQRQIPQAFLVLRYEEMQHDLKASLRTVLDFIGTPKMDESVLELMCAGSAFERQ